MLSMVPPIVRQIFGVLLSGASCLAMWANFGRIGRFSLQSSKIEFSSDFQLESACRMGSRHLEAT